MQDARNRHRYRKRYLGSVVAVYPSQAQEQICDRDADPDPEPSVFSCIIPLEAEMKFENPETEVLTHSEIYSGKIVGLHVDTIRQSSGKTTVREVVLHPGGVTAVPVLNDGRLLLIRQFRYPIGKFILELPAGKLDSGQSPKETVARELEEEIGYKAGALQYETTFYTTPGICNEAIHFFIARNLVPCSQRLEEGEHITVEVYSLSECLEMIRKGEILDGKTILGILWYRMKLESWPPPV
jgi:ADP-ribose pyrophosphatase